MKYYEIEYIENISKVDLIPLSDLNQITKRILLKIGIKKEKNNKNKFYFEIEKIDKETGKLLKKLYGKVFANTQKITKTLAFFVLLSASMIPESLIANEINKINLHNQIELQEINHTIKVSDNKIMNEAFQESFKKIIDYIKNNKEKFKIKNNKNVFKGAKKFLEDLTIVKKNLDNMFFSVGFDSTDKPVLIIDKNLEKARMQYPNEIKKIYSNAFLHELAHMIPYILKHSDSNLIIDKLANFDERFAVYIQYKLGAKIDLKKVDNIIKQKLYSLESKVIFGTANFIYDKIDEYEGKNQKNIAKVYEKILEKIYEVSEKNKYKMPILFSKERIKDKSNLIEYPDVISINNVEKIESTDINKFLKNFLKDKKDYTPSIHYPIINLLNNDKYLKDLEKEVGLNNIKIFLKNLKNDLRITQQQKKKISLKPN